jgi:hypothetical protein
MSELSTPRATVVPAVVAGLMAGAAVGAIVGNAPAGVITGLAMAVIAAGAALLRRRRPARAARRDPFTVGEPWRQLVRDAQRAGERLQITVASMSDGPLRERMSGIVTRLEHGLDEAWTIAQRGDEIDDAVRRLDPAGLRSKLHTLETHQSRNPSKELIASIESRRAQIATTERLQAESDKMADRLRLTQARLDELVGRAAEIALGSGDTERYEHDVDDLVIELEALRQAVDETNRA